MNQTPSKPKILIADDEPENIRVLSKILKGKYSIMAATGGQEALELLFSGIKADLILLDIMMPDTDGYEVCRQLKNNPATECIPVIFITALDNIENELKGFETGAADYIAKPFHPGIVEARVKAHIELKRYRNHLEDEVRKRADQLIHSERLAVLGTLSAGIIHEISNQVLYLTGNTELLAFQFNDIRSLLISKAEDSKGDEDEFMSSFKNIQESVNTVNHAGKQVISVLNTMKNFARRDDSGKQPVSIEKCIKNALQLCRNDLKRKLRVIQDTDKDIPLITGNAGQIEQVLVNLFKNAADAAPSGEKGKLMVSVAHKYSTLRITVEDDGTGIGEERLERIWQPFFSTKGRDKGLGLGLSICKKIIEDHEGKIWGENRREGGSRFVIELPVKNKG